MQTVLSHSPNRLISLGKTDNRSHKLNQNKNIISQICDKVDIIHSDSFLPIGVFVCSLLIAIGCAFGVYINGKAVLMEKLDDKLRAGAVLAHGVVDSEFHSGITGPESVSEQAYTAVVNRFNAICRDANFQYLWSNLVLPDGRIVFTSATSPSLTDNAGDHAAFFETHRDPGAFEPVLTARQDTYSTFENEWGSGRMLLMYHKDSSGRPYVIGASASLDSIGAGLRNLLSRSMDVGLVVWLAGLILGYSTIGFMQRKGKPAPSLPVDPGLSEEEVRKLKQTFLANMSHEMRTPLNAVIGFSDVISQEMLGPMDNPTYAGYVRNIRESGEHLLNMVDEALDAAALHGGTLKLREEAFNLRALIQDTVEAARAEAEEKGISLSLQESVHLWNPQDLPFFGDAKRIRQIVENLLNNATRFTPSGGRIMVGLVATENHVQISVEDTGVGMESSKLDGILDHFGSKDWGIADDENHIGLGMVLVYGLARLHGGDVGIESRKGEGTTVIVSLPPGWLREEELEQEA
ncbi:MAG: sensor histidine kinase [Magnetovibrionaceae bacterium]